METLLWFSNTVFTAAGGTEAAVFSPVNKKAKPQSPASRTNTHSCREGSPMQRVHAGGGGQGGSPLLPSYWTVIHAKASLRVPGWLPFKRAIFLNLLIALTQLLV